MNEQEYNPLDYTNLTHNCVQELMRRGPYELPLAETFDGAGVYALFYLGSAAMYKRVKSSDSTWPIYVGKAVPPGSRKGEGERASKAALYRRIMEHTASIDSAKGTLGIGDFRCRYLVVTPLWITMAERFLIEAFRPVWNVCIEGFGNHDPGKGRHAGEIGWWDALHPGRKWAQSLKQTRNQSEAQQKLKDFLSTYEKKQRTVSAQEPSGEE